MLLKQLKQLTFSAPLRNVVFETDVERLARFYRSTALCQSVTTSKAPRKLSRDDRRAAVESFVSEYIAVNGGKYPNLKTIQKEVGGCYYIVRDIFQELKLRPEGHLSTVAKTLSAVSTSVPNDASSQTLNDAQPHHSASNTKLSAVVVDPAFQAGSPDTIETGSNQRQTDIDFSRPTSDETDLQRNNLVITATHDKIETETDPNNDVESKCDSNSQAPRKLSRDDRRAAVESFVNEYRSINAGKFPTLKTIHKEVGGCYYIVRDVFQELKLKPEAHLPIVAKTLSAVSTSLPNNFSSKALNDAQSHSSACNAEIFSDVVGDPEFQASSPGIIETRSDQRQTEIDFSHHTSDETDLQSNNLVITATHDKRETETAPNSDVESNCDSNSQVPESQKSVLLEERLKNSVTEKEKNLTHLASQEVDHLKGAAVSANVVPTETRQVSERQAVEVETRKKSSAWSNIISFAKEFTNFWRKG